MKAIFYIIQYYILLYIRVGSYWNWRGRVVAQIKKAKKNIFGKNRI